jgi:hypothetical protein
MKINASLDKPADLGRAARAAFLITNVVFSQTCAEVAALR